jgi:hypothetical protein
MREYIGAMSDEEMATDYPELADHQKVQLTLKPILPQGCDHIKEEITMKFNFMKRIVVASVTGAVLLLGTGGLAIS